MPNMSSALEQRATSHGWQHHSLLVLFTGLWGANFVLADMALREMTPIAFSVARFVMGFFGMFAILVLQGGAGHGRFRLFPAIARADRLRLLLVSVLGATLAPWLGIEGLALSTGARASLWLALGPVMSVAIGLLLRTEHIGKFGYVGVALAGLGTIALALDGFRSESGYWEGDLLLFLALLAAVAELHYIKPLAFRYGATPVVTARTAIGCVLYVLIASPSFVGQAWLSFGLWTWIAILAGGAVGIGVGQWVKIRALEALGPTRVIIYGNLVPVSALVLAWLALGTAPTLLEYVAAVLIVVGAVSLEVFDSYKPRGLTTTEGAM